MLKRLRRVFISIFLSFSFLLLLNHTVVFSAGEFDTDFNVTYKVNESGITEVSNRITLTNVYSNMYATSYSIILDSIHPLSIKVYDSSGPLAFDTNVSDEKTEIKINFADSVVGKGKSRIFWVNYEESSFAIRTGEVWEVTIPRLDENSDFGRYDVNILIPKSFGQEAYVSPNPRSRVSGEAYLEYLFNKEDVTKTGITAGFGQFQVFSFNLNYHLENPLAKEAKTEITLPPDTAFQKIYYDKINPQPSNMYVDSDGNWIAEYVLKPRERVDVNASGQVQIFASLRPYPKPSDESLKENLTEEAYWQTSDSNIKNLAIKLKTPQEIYNFVTNNLKYDYERVKPNVERLGAVNALKNPDSAICMEFTDLFIALSRAAGIPAREVNGFAYTENPDIQPLSLVNDVLHAWPEYYDNQKEAWIPVDPTWGSTTGGVDYFSKLDLRHFTFVIHGKDSVKPYAAGSYKLGANPQKDVYVSFGTLPKERYSQLKLQANNEGWIPLISNKVDVTIENPGPLAIYNLKPRIYFDSEEKAIDDYLEVLLPFQSYKTYVDIPFSFLATKTPERVRIIVDGEQVSVLTNKRQILIYNVLFLFFLFFAILLTLFLRLKGVRISKLKPKTWNFFKKKTE